MHEFAWFVQKDKSKKNKTVCTKSIVWPFFNCWYCILMMVCYENLLYVEENERVQFSFNSQTAVPRLISRLWEREGNSMLNEKKRDGREKNPFPLIWYGNISCSHTHHGYENKWLGGRWRLWGRGELGSPERCSACCFLEKKDRGGRKGGNGGGIEIWKMWKESKQKNFILHVDILCGSHNFKGLWRG